MRVLSLRRPQQSRRERQAQADQGPRPSLRCFAFSPLLASLACAGTSAPLDRIVKGTPTSDYPEVAAIVNPEGNQWCSATLVAPGCLLTAAHCADGLDAFFTAYFGSQIGTSPLAHVNLAGSAAVHPSYDKVRQTHDLAIVPLVSIPAISPLGLGPRPTSASIVTIVGFGRNESNVYGVKREATVEVDSITGNQIFIDGTVSNTCSGDSGGPHLMPSGDDLVLVGVTSFGDASCAAFGAANTTDNEATWIAETIAATCTATAEGNGVFFGGFESGTGDEGGWSVPE